MKKEILKNLPYFYLGASISIFADVHFYNWQFYPFSLPSILLILKNNIEGNENG